MGTPETEEEVAAARAREKLVLFLCLVYIVRAGRRKGEVSHEVRRREEKWRYKNNGSVFYVVCSFESGPFILNTLHRFDLCQLSRPHWIIPPVCQ